jgi:hypothetical protein
MTNIRKALAVIFAWLIIAMFLQYNHKYYFYYVEQMQMFLYDSLFAAEEIMQPGGLSMYIALFLEQFYVYPFTGAAINAALILFAGCLLWHLTTKINSNSRIIFFPLLALILLLFMHLTFFYFLQATIALIFCLTALIVAASIKSNIRCLIFSFTSIVVLHLTAGSVGILFAVSVALIKIFKDRKHFPPYLLLILSSVIISFSAVWFGLIPGFRYAYLPDMYYNTYLEPPFVIYLIWICVPLSVCSAGLFNRKKMITGVRQIVCLSLQSVIAALIFWQAYPCYVKKNANHFMEYDYYVREEQWDKIIEKSKVLPMTNYTYLNYTNMALANLNMFGDRLFYFEQKGLYGLYPQWNSTANIAVLLSDIHFTTGNVAKAQQMAFEANINYNNSSPRLIKRLIQTNIVFGAYPVAEKYISKLEKTLYYRKWATHHRKFLYNDKAVDGDTRLGSLRKSILREDHLYSLGSHEEELQKMAENNPANRLPVQYLVATCLINKDMQSFKYHIDRYYGTTVLPALPLSFREAVIILYESDNTKWDDYLIDRNTISRFAGFKKAVLANKSNKNISGIIKRDYGNTYWYYYLFQN